jgi:protein-tyrosine phosphatase
MNKILFVCTGNYYRSRFAEEYFNHLAKKHDLHWLAGSKGLSQNMPSLNNPGSISEHTLEALKNKGIEGKATHRYPRPIVKADFPTHHRIIAMSEAEHRPMIEERFLAQSKLVEYFEVGDLPVETPETAINKISKNIEKLVEELKLRQKVIMLVSE